MTRHNWPLWLASLLCVALSMTLTARANPPDATYHGIEETQITDFKFVEVSVGDTCYGAIIDYVQKSSNEGTTWSNWRSFNSTVQSLACDSSGNIYVSVGDTLKKLNQTGTCTDVLAFPATAYSWHIAENDSLYCATYSTGEAVDDTTGAYVYRSSTGDHWSLLNHPESRHYHFVAAHPWNDTLYTSRGDGAGNQFIEKSGDNGVNWTSIRGSDCKGQPTSFAFTPTRAIFGSDCGGVGDVNKLYYQDNTNGSWTVADSLSGAQENFVWSMTQDVDRVIFAGTVGKSNEDNDVRIYASWDSASTWKTVKTFDLVDKWGGVTWMSQNATATGHYMFYTIGSDDLSNTMDTYRFNNSPVWTVGDGGDFANIATALADFRVGASDTLIILAGSHTIQDDAMLTGMTVRGATQDASLYLMKNGAANANGFTVATAGVTFKDLTFRTLTEITTSGKAMIKVTDGGQLTVTRCAFRNCDANSAPGIFADGGGPGTTNLTLINCTADSCSGDYQHVGETAGFVYADSLDALTVDDLTATNNWGKGDGGVFRIYHHNGHVLIENSLFVDNRCFDEGAAVFFYGDTGSSIKLWHCTFNGNETANVDEGQVKFKQGTPVSVISHCIFADSDSTYALSSAGHPDSVRYCDSWNTGNDNFGWNAPACTDTIHIDPIYNDTCLTAPCYKAKAKDCRDCADGSYMGWLHYIPHVPIGGHHRTSSRRR